MTIVVIPCNAEVGSRYDEEDLLYLLDQCGMSPAEVEAILNPYLR